MTTDRYTTTSIHQTITAMSTYVIKVWACSSRTSVSTVWLWRTSWNQAVWCGSMYIASWKRAYRMGQYSHCNNTTSAVISWRRHSALWQKENTLEKSLSRYLPRKGTYLKCSIIFSVVSYVLPKHYSKGKGNGSCLQSRHPWLHMFKTLPFSWQGGHQWACNYWSNFGSVLQVPITNECTKEVWNTKFVQHFCT